MVVDPMIENNMAAKKYICIILLILKQLAPLCSIAENFS